MSPGLHSSLRELVISVEPFSPYFFFSPPQPFSSGSFLTLSVRFSFVYASQTANSKASIFGSETSFYMLISGRQPSATPCIACLQSCDCDDVQNSDRGQGINSSCGRAGGKSALTALDRLLLLVEDINRN